MAIVFTNQTSVVGTGGSVSGTEPAGTTQNDILIALYLTDSTVTTLTIPTGWTSIYSGFSGTNFFYNLCYVVRGVSAPALNFGHTGSISVYRELFILGFSGVDTTSPIDVSNDGGTFTGNPPVPNPPPATPTTNNTMALATGIGWNGSAAGGWTPPSGYVIQTNNTAGNDGVIATKVLATTATEDPAAFANGSNAGNADGWQATIILAPAKPAIPTSLAWITA